MQKRSIFCIIVLFSSVYIASVPHVDANGYRYKDETTIRQHRKIAILAYGSLVRQQANLQTGARLEATQFSPTEIKLPISLSRYSQGSRRITAVIDSNGDPKRVWTATSVFTFLPNARNNLAAREGSRYLGQSAGYDLTNICYMKKLLPNQTADRDETMIDSTDWAMRASKGRQRRKDELPASSARKIAAWADAHAYTAVIWASFPSNMKSKKDVVRKLLHDSTVLKNTQQYVKNLPDGAQSALERAVIAGKSALRAFF